MPKRHWLMKSEPDVFSIADLEKAKTTSWEGVRNYQARNHLREMQVGDEVLFYHSSAEPSGVAGLATVARAAYADLSALDKKSDYFDEKATKDDPRWSLVDVAWKATFPRVIPLDELRTMPALKDMLVLRKGNRLSVTPVTADEFKAVVALSKKR